MIMAYLKVFSLFCQPRFSSSRILTHRKIISSPPLKSIPSWTISPSFTGYGLDSVPGGLSRMWLRKVPELLLTSLIYHFPSSYQNSQWRRLTTLLLKPTGAAEGAFTGILGWLSLSEYLPTRMTSLPLGRVREIGPNLSDGRVARGSTKVLNRMEGRVSRPPPPSCRVRASPVVAERARVISPVVWRFPSAILEPFLEEGKGMGGASAARSSDEIPVAGPDGPLSFDESGDRRSGCPRVGTRCEKRLVRVDDEVGL